MHVLSFSLSVLIHCCKIMSFLIPDIQESAPRNIYIYIHLKYTAIYIKFMFLKCSKYIALAFAMFLKELPRSRDFS